jgi:hypothetical protein
MEIPWCRIAEISLAVLWGFIGLPLPPKCAEIFFPAIR